MSLFVLLPRSGQATRRRSRGWKRLREATLTLVSAGEAALAAAHHRSGSAVHDTPPSPPVDGAAHTAAAETPPEGTAGSSGGGVKQQMAVVEKMHILNEFSLSQGVCQGFSVGLHLRSVRMLALRHHRWALINAP